LEALEAKVAALEGQMSALHPKEDSSNAKGSTAGKSKRKTQSVASS